MTIKELQDEIVEEFSMLTDWMDRYSLLIELGNELVDFEEAHRVDQNLIEGCQSKVWLHAWLEEGNIRFMADSDAIIVKGIVALLIRVLDNRPPDEILNADLFFVDKIGLKEHLSPTRSNGLVAMIKQMRMYALAYKTKMEKN
ncbi:SufE family protein [Alkaliflexus imshenetskii]|uniref:SufE family protein n=1 Tax=Alkaliflexus imshenetskii TaxID=286730 RepID=UPI000478C00C|nr:SufE family protein [Alkaliflexus imshenetskii]